MSSVDEYKNYFNTWGTCDDYSKLKIIVYAFKRSISNKEMQYIHNLCCIMRMLLLLCINERSEFEKSVDGLFVARSKVFETSDKEFLSSSIKWEQHIKWQQQSKKSLRRKTDSEYHKYKVKRIASNL